MRSWSRLIKLFSPCGIIIHYIFSSYRRALKIGLLKGLSVTEEEMYEDYDKAGDSELRHLMSNRITSLFEQQLKGVTNYTHFFVRYVSVNALPFSIFDPSKKER